MNLFRDEEAIEKKFHVSTYIIIYEFLSGLVDLSAGVGLAIFGTRIYELYQASLIQELAEDPTDLIANLSEKFVPGLLTHNAFIILYWIAYGLVKIVGAIGLIYKQNWGVDLLVLLIILIAPFQLFDFVVHRNFLELLYIIVGFLVAFYLVEFRPAAWISRILRRKQ
jgi:uncharacterized membrane protein